MDSAIKLFGRTIPLIEGKLKGNDQQRHNEGNSALSNTNDREDRVMKDSEKFLRKPGRVLSCPRCNSLDTKFCYYNNYNINQPRHFCKNCQRYWTAGGSMRNVPVGAGKRKNRNTGANSVTTPPSEEAPSDVAQSAPAVVDTGQSRSISCDVSSPARHSKVTHFHHEGDSCESIAPPFQSVGSETRTTQLDSSPSGDTLPTPKLNTVTNSEHCSLQKLPPMSTSCSMIPSLPFISSSVSGSRSSCKNETIAACSDGPNGCLLPSTALNLGSGSSILGKQFRATTVQGEDQQNGKKLWFTKNARNSYHDADTKSSIKNAFGGKSTDNEVIGGSLKQTASQDQIPCPTQVFCPNQTPLTHFQPFQ